MSSLSRRNKSELIGVLALCLVLGTYLISTDAGCSAILSSSTRFSRSTLVNEGQQGQNGDYDRDPTSKDAAETNNNNNFHSSNPSSGSDCMISFGKYNGHQYSSPGQTIGQGKCLVESEWAQIMQHSVQLLGQDEQRTGNDKGENIIDDWLFINYHDRVTILVEDPYSTNDDIRFLVLRQNKYALGGRQSLAVVGGIVEQGEDAASAARREVREEMNGIVCENFIRLGTFRTDANRGMGWIHSFLARGCTLATESENSEHETPGFDPAHEVGKPDTETQEIISVSLKDLSQSAKTGGILEVQWSNTVALALLYLYTQD